MSTHLTPQMLHFKLDRTRVIPCLNGKSAYSWFQDPGKWDMAIIDLTLPDMDGISLCGALKSNPQSRNIPIIVLTSNLDNKKKIEARLNNADLFLNKPILPDDIIRAVKSLFGSEESRKLRSCPIKIGTFEIDPKKHTVAYDGESIDDMSVRLFDVLYIIASYFPNSISKKTLVDQIAFNERDLLVEKWVSRLRDKLNSRFQKDLIQAVHGEGYRLNISIPQPVEIPAVIKSHS